MTKEEILVNSGEAYEYYHRLEVSPVSEAYNAMDVFAKQESINFHLFVENNYQPVFGSYIKQINFKDCTEWPDLDTLEKFTLNELYNLYLEHKKLNP